MNLAELQRKLIAAARSQVLSASVPYAFEQRILARLRGRPVADVWGLWAGALWRAAVPCLAVTLLLGAWSWFEQPAPANVAGTDWPQALENALLAGVEQPELPSVW